MEAIIGFVLGFLTVPLWRRLTERRQKPKKKCVHCEMDERDKDREEAFLKAYRQLLTYDGEKL